MTPRDAAPAATPSAIVTGGSSGLGLAVASFLAGQGYDLSLVGRDRDRLHSAAESLSPLGIRVQPVQMDVSLPTAGEEVVLAHQSYYGGLDCVVVSAGTSRRSPLAETDQRAVRRLLAVHVESAFDLARSAMPLMRRTPGRPPAWFILMSSVAAVIPPADFAAYSAAKAAVVSLARSINREEAEQGVRSCALCPAFVDTPLTAPLRASVPPEAMIRPTDVAEAVRFLMALSPTAVVSQLVIERVGASPLEP